MKKFFDKFFGEVNFSEQVELEENDLAEKRKTAIEFLGEKWILHPVHNIKK